MRTFILGSKPFIVTAEMKQSDLGVFILHTDSAVDRHFIYVARKKPIDVPCFRNIVQQGAVRLSVHMFLFRSAAIDMKRQAIIE
jgi:hypothetical protein